MSAVKNETIFFYRQGEVPYGVFSNFAQYEIDLDGKIWPTTEHYFQAQKFVGTIHEEEIRKMKTGGDAAIAGRKRSKPLRKDWEEVKDSIMEKALWAKFTQHEDLKKILLETGDAFLVEHTKNDSYWADGTDEPSKIGPGKNMLGLLLMSVREKLRAEQKDK